MWQYWDYGTSSVNLIAGWYAGLSLEAKDKLASLLKTNAKIENPREWLGGFKFMKGALRSEKIWQLSTQDAGGQVRLLGIFGTKRKQAILLMGCFHKDSVYTPADALESAVTRARNFRNGMVKIYERQIRTDI